VVWIGIEPIKPKATDLQSAELTTCSTIPYTHYSRQSNLLFPETTIFIYDKDIFVRRLSVSLRVSSTGSVEILLYHINNDLVNPISLYNSHPINYFKLIY
jgi:hypothetical protein